MVVARMRIIVDLPQDSIDALDKLCKKDRVSRAELMRRAVAEYLSRTAVPEDDVAFGLWKNCSRDSRAYEDSIRDEWHS